MSSSNYNCNLFYNTHRIPLLIPRDETRVVDLDDDIASIVHVRQLGGSGFGLIEVHDVPYDINIDGCSMSHSARKMAWHTVGQIIVVSVEFPSIEEILARVLLDEVVRRIGRGSCKKSGYQRDG